MTAGRRTSRITNRLSTVDDHLELEGITEPHFHTAVVIDFIENPLWYMRQKVGDLKWSMGAKTADVTGPNISDLDKPGNSNPDVSGLDNNWYKGFIDTSADINSIGSDIPHDDKTFSETLLSGNRFIRQVPGVDLIGQVTRMPRNSILGVITSNQEAQRSQVFELLYPFFPQHFCLPAKAGEKIWVYFETTPDGSRGQGYWLCRKSSTLQVEDVNYAHLDRVSEIFGMASPAGSSDINRPFSFPDGGIGATYNNSLPGTDPYERILNASISYRNFTGEPVPAFSKRSPDLVLQGSNNTLISLGQDRPSVLSLPDAGDVPGIGTIDIVAGRGQTSATAPTPVENTRPSEYSAMQYEEADKYTQSKDPSSANMAEGDPSFASDLSRIYVSMKTNGDTNFSVGPIPMIPVAKTWDFKYEDPLGFNFSDIQKYIAPNIADWSWGIPPPRELDSSSGRLTDVGWASGLDASSTGHSAHTQNSGTGPYIVQKSRHLRMLATGRGSIKIVKDSAPESPEMLALGGTDGYARDSASIVMDGWANIQIAGRKIILGTTALNEEGERASESMEGAPEHMKSDTGTQSFVRGQDLVWLLQRQNEVLAHLFGQLYALFMPAIPGTPAQDVIPRPDTLPLNATPGYGGPNPALVVAGQCLKNAAMALYGSWPDFTNQTIGPMIGFNHGVGKGMLPHESPDLGDAAGGVNGVGIAWQLPKVLSNVITGE